MRINRKGQQVVEALMTYGWMILLLSAIIILLFLLGFFSTLNFVSPSPTISGFTGVKVTAVVANYSYIEFYLTNSLSVSVNLNKFILNYNSSFFSDIKCQYLTLSPGQNSICFAKISLANTRDTVGLGIGFSVTTNINASSNGTMSFMPANIILPLPSSITEFSEEGLPSGVQWWADYNGINHSSTGTTILFATSYGNYSFTVGKASSNGCTYTALPSSGHLESGLVQQIIFISSCAATFIEKELPSGTSWQVTYAGAKQSTTTNLLVFTNEKTGTHSFSVNDSIVGGCVYSPSPSSGTLTVGSYQYVRFLGQCTTTFRESGLPSSYTWSVTYNSVTKTNSSPDNISYFGAPGNFSYTVPTLSNSSSVVDCSTTYTPSPSSGYAVMGSTTSISFSTLTTCTNTFEESGLPSGYTWSVTYDDVPGSATTPNNIMIVTKQSNSGIFTYTATATVSGLVCTAPSASVEQGTTYDFSSWSCITNFTESGLPSGTQWYVYFDGINQSSTITTNKFTTAPGSSLSYTVYNVYISAVSGLNCNAVYVPSPSSGTTNTGLTVAITFTASTTCTTTFDESGLITNYPWNVTYNGVTNGFVQTTSTQFVTTTAGSTIPTYAFSLPTLNSYTIEWAYGTSSYQGQVYNSLPVQAFPSSLSDLNNNGVACSSPYNSEGYSANAYVYFSSSVTFTVWTDDATEIFYQPYGSSSWTSVFGGAQWRGQGTSTSTAPYTSTVSVTPGLYRVAVDWSNICGPGMSFIGISGARTVSPQFNVIAWTPSSNTVQLLPYSDVTANPISPSSITIQQTGSWANSPFGYINSIFTPSPSSGNLEAGKTQSVSYSSTNNSYTSFYVENMPPGASSFTVSYDGITSPSTASGSFAVIQQNNIGNPGSYTATATTSASDGVTCSSSAAVTQGTTYTFTNWQCEIPITVYNPSSSATASPFDQEVFIDTNLYSSFLASNMQNVEFTYNGNVLDSWYEGNYQNTQNGIDITDAIFWLNLPQIGGGGSETIDAVFYYPTSANLFNGNTVGEAPQLSSTYAQYDNGGNVFFDGYWNYAGTALPSGFSTVNTGGESGESITVNNGLSIKYSNNWWYVYGVNGPSYNPSLLVQAKMSISDFNGMTLEMGWPASDSGTVQSVGPCSVFHGYTIRGNGAGGYSLAYNPGSNTGCTTLSSDSTALSNNTFYTYTAYWEGTGNEGGSLSPPYLGTVSSTDTSVSQANTHFFLGLYVNKAGQGGTEVVDWTRLLPYTSDILSPSYSNPGGLTSGYSLSYPPGILSTVNYPYTDPSAPSCSGYELASSSDSAQLNGECNWEGGSVTLYFAGGNTGYVGFNIVTSAGQIVVGGHSDNRCLDTTGGSAELSLYLPAQTLYVHAVTGGGSGSCGNGGVLIN